MNRDWWRKYFIPHQDNQYKPQILQKAAVLGMMLLIVITFVLANFQSFIWVASDWMVSTILPAVIVEETNAERTALALSPLNQNEKLAQAAQLKAEHMAQNEYFAHYSPDGTTPWYWFGEVDYNYLHAGENLAIHFTDSSEVVEAWMNSPAHRDNIVNDQYAEIGIGTARGSYQGFPTVYVVQLFGTPRASVAVTEAVVSNVVVEEEEGGLPEIETELAEGDDTEDSGVVLATTETASESADTDPASTTEIVSVSATTSKPAVERPTLVVYDNNVVAYTSHLSTSTVGIPAAVTPNNSQLSTPPTLAALTQPHKVLQGAYLLIGSFVALVLLLSIVIEIRRQEPVQIAYGVGLMTAMMALFYIHMTIAGGVLIV